MTIRIYNRKYSVHHFTRTRLPAGSVHVRDQSAKEHLVSPRSRWIDKIIQDQHQQTVEAWDSGQLYGQPSHICWCEDVLVCGMLWIMGSGMENVMDNEECYGEC